jgi:hypothetical protein
MPTAPNQFTMVVMRLLGPSGEPQHLREITDLSQALNNAMDKTWNHIEEGKQ